MSVKVLESEKLKYANAWGLLTFMQSCGCRCGHHTDICMLFFSTSHVLFHALSVSQVQMVQLFLFLPFLLFCNFFTTLTFLHDSFFMQFFYMIHFSLFVYFTYDFYFQVKFFSRVTEYSPVISHDFYSVFFHM